MESDNKILPSSLCDEQMHIPPSVLSSLLIQLHLYPLSNCIMILCATLHTKCSAAFLLRSDKELGEALGKNPTAFVS